MSKNIVLWDLIFYIIFPIVVWNFSKGIIGDYYAMLLSSVPGIIYSLIRFISLKRVNFFGVFMIFTLSIGTLIDILSGSAIQMMWNNVVYSYILSLFYIVTLLVNKPLFLFLSLDLVEMQGQNRKKMKEQFYLKNILKVFKLITLGFAFREILIASINIWLINKYGVDAYDKGLIFKQILSWLITGVSMYGFIYISKLLYNMNKKQLSLESS